MSRELLIGKNYEGFIPKSKKEYNVFIDLILRKADEICVTIKPSLDSIAEFEESMWGELADSIITTEYAQAATDNPGESSFLVYLKKDYKTIEFFKARKNIFDYSECDKITGITLEDPAFIKDNIIFCYTLTHESICEIEESIYKELMTKFF
ncbi:hypothetical protein C8E03_103444 [Lachnotalea glycerini]|uniref:Uncharacterized protein n=1 Tax=Lachnotalea glycerini TaxID=1763509 RepID=A0A318EP24_9FIRM|nr:hypothetical protein [Lachnotalea glycerini]OYP37934.1 hypothetical protein CG709_05705 [Lachnotalea glycerini]PXV91873.1 hypothetical protein C8E03_103444 [Lachnotalea glycerini]